jgi:hypothetical protein
LPFERKSKRREQPCHQNDPDSSHEDLHCLAASAEFSAFVC